MVEVLGRLIKRKREKRLWKGVNIIEIGEALTHLQFVDDTFLAGTIQELEAKVMKQTLELYGRVSGQFINWNKLEVFFFNTLH